VTELEAVGFSGVFSLPPEMVLQIRMDCESEEFTNRHDPAERHHIKFSDLINQGKGVIYGNFEMHKKSPTLSRLIHGDLGKVATAYLGSSARFMNTQVWVTFPGATEHNNKDFGWHYDVDDFKFLKFFCYLNPVTKDHGPHLIVPGSHNTRHLFRFFNRQVGNADMHTFGDPLTLMGEAGTFFFEDTIIYHKGTRPISPRVILQVQFGVSDNNLQNLL